MGAGKIVVAVLLHAGGQVTSSQDAPSQSVMSFGASLCRQLTSGNFDNLIFSPFSIFGALTMTLPGADGVTKRELMVEEGGTKATAATVVVDVPTSASFNIFANVTETGSSAAAAA